MEIDSTTFAAEVRRVGAALSPLWANLLFTRQIAYPDLTPSTTLAELDQLTHSAAQSISAHQSAEARGQALAEYLFGTFGLTGNQADYGDPRNSFIHEVLQRRLGLPISLSAIYLQIGRQLELPVEGVGMPGHFIVSVRGEAGPIYLDPFHGGGALTLTDCARLVQQATGYGGLFNQRWLATTSGLDIVIRMLSNLRNAYAQVEDWPHALRVVECLREVQPDEPTHVRDLGMVLYRNGALRSAAERLNEYLTLHPQAADAAEVRRGRDQLVEELSRLN
jgi:regulator of sirC expression with transglutaminase-like and TPR domain